MEKDNDVYYGIGLIIVVLVGLSIWGFLGIKSYISENRKEKAYEEALKANTNSSFVKFLNNFNTNRLVESDSYLVKADSVLWHRTLNSSNYEYYVENVPKIYGAYGNYMQLNRAKDSIEERNWKTDSNAWNRAVELNSIDAYKKYVNQYPYGYKVDKGKKNIIDMEVDNIFSKDYGTMPELNKISEGNGKTSHISIYNNTRHTLTIWYSGPNSRLLVIKSRSRSEIQLENGKYRIGASVDSGAKKYARIQSLTGGYYDIEYYISYGRRY